MHAFRRKSVHRCSQFSFLALFLSPSLFTHPYIHAITVRALSLTTHTNTYPLFLSLSPIHVITSSFSLSQPFKPMRAIAVSLSSFIYRFLFFKLLHRDLSLPLSLSLFSFPDIIPDIGWFSGFHYKIKLLVPYTAQITAINIYSNRIIYKVIRYKVINLET